MPEDPELVAEDTELRKQFEMQLLSVAAILSTKQTKFDPDDAAQRAYDLMEACLERIEEG